MAFGNRLGVKIEHNVDPRDFFAAGWGNIVCEVPDGKVGELSIPYTVIGEVTDKGTFEYGSTVISMEEALKAWTGTLEKVFPTASGAPMKAAEETLYNTDKVYVCKHKVAKPTVFIPAMPGTNCELDSAKAFEAAGAETIVVYSATRMHPISVLPSSSTKRISRNPRSSCSRVDSPQVMSRMVRLNSSLRYSATRR